MPSLPGPNGPIAYERDALGYPSIEGRDLAEGTYALGYLHARDRLVQVTLMGLASHGQLMSVLGDIPFARLIDQSVRAFGLPAHLADQTRRIEAPGLALLEAYSAGFNRAVSTHRRPLLLRLLKLRPFECNADNLVCLFRFVTYFGLTGAQLASELMLTDLAGRGAPERFFARVLGPAARGLDLEALRQVQVPPEFSRMASASGGSALAGSNAFAVSGARSASGGALLMGEFHMEVGRFPPILYAAHLGLPGGAYLSGMTIPGLSWFVAGRTEHVGWSYTFAHADNVDIVVERVKGGRYLAQGEWRNLRERREQVRIKNKPPETWVYHENEYGTVLGDVEAEAERPCVRLSGLDETHSAFSAGARIIECRTVDDLAEVQRAVRSVSLEAILADKSGSIASIVTGRVDQRPAGWTGAYPVTRERLAPGVPLPLTEEMRPTSFRPELGALASANQGGQGPFKDLWCTLPEPNYRFQRISQLLAERAQHDVASMLAITYDTLDLSARRLLAAWQPHLPDAPLAHRLLRWAGAQADRELLGLFHKLHEEASLELLAQDIGLPAAQRLRDESMLVLYQERLDAVLALEHPHLLDAAGLTALLSRAFARAVPGYQDYSVPVRLRFRHLVTQGRSPAALGFDSKRVELPGSPVAVFQCRVCPVAGQQLVYAPAFHLLIDMSRRGAWYNLPGGASESRLGPGYGKGVEEWLSGELLPLGAPENGRLKRT